MKNPMSEFEVQLKGMKERDGGKEDGSGKEGGEGGRRGGGGVEGGRCGVGVVNEDGDLKLSDGDLMLSNSSDSSSST